MSYSCQVRIAGRTDPLNISIPDSVNIDDPAAVRTAVEAEVRRYYLDTRHIAPGEVRYDLYVDHDRDPATAMRRLRSSSADGRTTATSWGGGGNRLWMDVSSSVGNILTATVAGPDGRDLEFDMDPNTDGIQRLVEISYTSDGDDSSVSDSELRSAYNELRARFPAGSAGEEQFRQFYVRNPMIRFGAGENQSVPLHTLMARLGERPPGSMPVTGTGAEGDGATDPTSPDSIVNNYLTNPSPANLARLRADRAATDRLIARLLAALEAGNLDVLMPLMDAVARLSNMTVAEIGAKTARILGQTDQQSREIGDRLARVNMGATSARERGQASQDLQTLQLQMQQNTQMRQQVTGMLQSVMDMSRSIGETGRDLRQADLARRRASMGA